MRSETRRRQTGLNGIQDEVVILGAGPQATVVIATLRENGIRIKAVLDDDRCKHDQLVSGVSVVGGRDSLDTLRLRSVSAFVAIGNNAARTELSHHLRKRGWSIMNAIHPSAVVMQGVTLGSGILICAGATLVTGSKLSDDVVINTGASIDHDSIVHTGAYVAPGVHTAGGVSVGERAFIGIGALLGPGVSIGAGAIVGAGSVVLEDVPPASLVVGAPARFVRSLPQE